MSDTILALGISVVLLQELGQPAALQGRAAAQEFHGVGASASPPPMVLPSRDADKSGDADSSHHASRTQVKQPTRSSVTTASNIRNCLYLNRGHLWLTGSTIG